jgi:uncharacterized 2Fe-2S/4Fe-4S cluster protein (DUF4445 family)
VEHTLTFTTSDGKTASVTAPTGMILAEAAQRAGVEINQPCGGQGRCGRCAVQITSGNIRRRSTLRLSAEDVEAGWALACQSIIEGNAQVHVPEQEKIERRLTTDRVAAEVKVPAGYDYAVDQTVRRVTLSLTPPNMDDQTDDWSRLQTALRIQAGLDGLTASLETLRKLGTTLRQGDWQISAVVDTAGKRLIGLESGQKSPDAPLWSVAIDIGTTTVSVWLVDLVSGQVKAQVAEYNGQIARGEDVISRIIYASKNGGEEEMRGRVLDTINGLIELACKRVKGAEPGQIVKAAVAGNSTMIHLLLGIPAASIRLSPFITAVNTIPTLNAREVGLKINPEGVVDCLPGVASYVGADITAGVLSSGLDELEAPTLFIDVGTNGEIVMGNREFLVTCACSAGPAFEGAGVLHGMRATNGAIEEVWINDENYEPTYRVIGGVKPSGLCGSGLISLLAEMFLTGVLDKAGNVNLTLPTPRVRQGEHGPEYVVAWGKDTEDGQDISITRVDVDNLLRAKAAIYAGFSVLADNIGMPLEAVDAVLVGGSFGKYINVEKAVQIGLLPDIEWGRFHFLGNTSVRGAYLGLLNKNSRQRIDEIAGKMTYIELSADNSFYDAFMSAMFLPHTDMHKFPSVTAALNKEE